MVAADQALKLGLEVWLSPEMWDKSQEETLAYITKAAAAAEKLRVQWLDKLVFLVGSELTLFYARHRPRQKRHAANEQPGIVGILKSRKT